MTPSRNLILINIDYLREDFVSGNWADTPYLDEISNDGIECRNLHATTTTTAPSVASILTGMYSENNGVNSLREAELNKDVPTMSKTFTQAGFGSTGLVLSPLAKEVEFYRGFDHYYYRKNDDYLVDDWYETALNRIKTLLNRSFFTFISGNYTHRQRH